MAAFEGGRGHLWSLHYFGEKKLINVKIDAIIYNIGHLKRGRFRLF